MTFKKITRIGIYGTLFAATLCTSPVLRGMDIIKRLGLWQTSAAALESTFDTLDVPTQKLVIIGLLDVIRQNIKDNVQISENINLMLKLLDRLESLENPVDDSQLSELLQWVKIAKNIPGEKKHLLIIALQKAISFRRMANALETRDPEAVKAAFEQLRSGGFLAAAWESTIPTILNFLLDALTDANTDTIVPFIEELMQIAGSSSALREARLSFYDTLSRRAQEGTLPRRAIEQLQSYLPGALEKQMEESTRRSREEAGHPDPTLVISRAMSAGNWDLVETLILKALEDRVHFSANALTDRARELGEEERFRKILENTSDVEDVIRAARSAAQRPTTEAEISDLESLVNRVTSTVGQATAAAIVTLVSGILSKGKGKIG